MVMVLEEVVGRSRDRRRRDGGGGNVEEGGGTW
jgi:hypothetical protein